VWIFPAPSAARIFSPIGVVGAAFNHGVLLHTRPRCNLNATETVARRTSNGSVLHETVVVLNTARPLQVRRAGAYAAQLS